MKSENIKKRKYIIFHFEDDIKITRKYQTTFDKAGFNYRYFNKTPADIVKIVRTVQPDLIIMDTTMPGMDGFATAKKIRDDKIIGSIPILGLSDVSMEAGVQWAKNLFMDDYLRHQDYSPSLVIKKVLSILKPDPVELSHYEKKVAEKKRLPFFQRNKKLSWILAILMIVSCPLFLYLYYNLPDWTVDYSSKYPQLLVKIKTVQYRWQFQGVTYEINKNLYQEVYNYYHAHPVKYYSEKTKLADYYQSLSENLEAGSDQTLSDLSEYFKSAAKKNQLTDNELVELIISFVQIIPFDDEKRDMMLSMLSVDQKIKNQTKAVTISALPRLPYETLFDQKGICTDKVLLAVGLIQQLGYGTALFDFDHHVAAGIQCPKDYSTLNSGYCMAEVTALGFFIGEISADVNLLGKAVERSAERYSQELWGVQTSEFEYDKVRIYKLSQGREYQKIINKAPFLLELASLEQRITDASNELQKLSELDDVYEQKLIEINLLINQYDEIAKKLK